MSELKFSIGGIGISIKWEDSGIVNWPHPLYNNFVSSDKPEIRLNIHCAGLPKHSSQLLFDGEEGGYWKLYRNSSKYIIDIFDTLTRKKNKVCFLEPDFSSGDVYVDSELDSPHYHGKEDYKIPIWSLPHLMRPLVQILLMNVLAERGGIMVHGLGINDRGKGTAFLGISGAGKSTMAGFWKGRKKTTLLSDEHLIIRKENGKFFLYGTPWPGDAVAVSSEKTPLERIFFISHFEENKILGKAAVSHLSPLLFLPFWDRERLESVLKFCEGLLEDLECKKLGFVKDKSVIDFIRGGQMRPKLTERSERKFAGRI